MSDSVFAFFGGGFIISLIVFYFLPIDKILRKIGARNKFRVVRGEGRCIIEVKRVGFQIYSPFPLSGLGLNPYFEDPKQAIETMNEWAEKYAHTDLEKAVEEHKIIAKSK